MLDPDDIARIAIDENRWEDLLLGRNGLGYRSRYSPSPYDTDLHEVMPSVCHVLKEMQEQDTVSYTAIKEIRESIYQAAQNISADFFGINAVCSLLYQQSYARSRNLDELGLDLKLLSFILNKAIIQRRGIASFSEKEDKRLRHVSKITQEAGGPSFYPEE